MTVETLSSNVVNYLIWRYLQEAGFASAAVHLSHEWIADPQTLPFVNHIGKGALIELVQDGLYFDTIQSEATGANRRWSFGSEHGQNFSKGRIGGPVMIPDNDYNSATTETNGNPPEGPAKKVPRRKKKSNGPERLNGDAMDIEANGINHAPSRGESEAVFSEAESPIIEEIPLPTTLNEGRSLDVQTEKVAELAPSSKTIKTKGAIKQTFWNNEDKEMMFVSGESTLRLYHVPSSQLREPIGTNLAVPHDRFEVSAACWKGSDVIAAALQDVADNEHGDSWRNFKLITIQGEDYRLISSTVGMVSQMRWNERSQLLLTVTTSDLNGSFAIWASDLSQSATESTKQPVLDAQWLSEYRFVVCGHGFVKVFNFEPESKEIKLLHEFETSLNWDKIVYDPVCNYGVMKSENGDSLGIVKFTEKTLETVDWEAQITDIGFQPITNPASHGENDPRLLAITSLPEAVQIWNVKGGFNMIRQMNLEGRPAVALSFSPDGYLLAAAGFDRVLIWQADRGGSPLARWHGTAEQHWDLPMSEKEQQEVDHGLGWDVDGRKLVYSMGNQLAIINFSR